MTVIVLVAINALLVGGIVGAGLAFVILSRRSVGQVVGPSRRGQPVVAAAAVPAATKIDELPARTLTATEQADWDRKQKKRILAKLQQDFPTMGEGKRNAAADELLARARSLLARVS